MATIIINDTAKLKKLKENPTLTREGQLQRFFEENQEQKSF